MNPNSFPKTRIGIIVWDIGQIGGIATQAIDFKKVFDYFQIPNDIIILNDKKVPGKIEESRIEANGKTFKLRGVELSVDFSNLNVTLNLLNERYDILLHTTACIHNDNTGWLAVYGLRKRNIVIISDVYWEKFYPYYYKAVHFVDKFFATNKAVKNYLKADKNIEAEELLHPFYFEPEFQKTTKLKTIIWANQWRSWKGIRTFVADAGKLNSTVLLFGGGREYYNLKNKIPSNAQYLGFQPLDYVIDSYKTGTMAVDLTGQSKKYWGHYNRTTIEPMFWRCAVVCNEKLVEPYSFIPADVVLGVNKKNFVEKINWLLENEEEWKNLTNRAFDWAINHYQPEKVVKQFGI